MASQGTLCSRSCFAATGRITCSENLRQYCCHSCCSSVSRKSTSMRLLATPAPVGAGSWLTDQSICPRSLLTERTAGAGEPGHQAPPLLSPAVPRLLSLVAVSGVLLLSGCSLKQSSSDSGGATPTPAPASGAK